MTSNEDSVVVTVSKLTLPICTNSEVVISPFLSEMSFKVASFSGTWCSYDWVAILSLLRLWDSFLSFSSDIDNSDWLSKIGSPSSSFLESNFESFLESSSSNPWECILFSALTSLVSFISHSFSDFKFSLLCSEGGSKEASWKFPSLTMTSSNLSTE